MISYCFVFGLLNGLLVNAVVSAFFRYETYPALSILAVTSFLGLLQGILYQLGILDPNGHTSSTCSNSPPELPYASTDSLFDRHHALSLDLREQRRRTRHQLGRMHSPPPPAAPQFPCSRSLPESPPLSQARSQPLSRCPGDEFVVESSGRCGGAMSRSSSQGSSLLGEDDSSHLAGVVMNGGRQRSLEGFKRSALAPALVLQPLPPTNHHPALPSAILSSKRPSSGSSPSMECPTQAAAYPTRTTSTASSSESMNAPLLCNDDQSHQPLLEAMDDQEASIQPEFYENGCPPSPPVAAYPGIPSPSGQRSCLSYPCRHNAFTSKSRRHLTLDTELNVVHAFPSSFPMSPLPPTPSGSSHGSLTGSASETSSRNSGMESKPKACSGISTPTLQVLGSSPEYGGTRPLHFLVVDPNPVHQRILMRLLTSQFPGASASCCAWSAQCVRFVGILCRRFRVVALYDIGSMATSPHQSHVSLPSASPSRDGDREGLVPELPEVGGKYLQLVSRLRMMYSPDELQIIGVSDCFSLAIREHCLAHGMHELLAKPISRESLHKSVNEVLQMAFGQPQNITQP